MAKQAMVARAADLEPIDRLEEKVRLLVALVTKQRADLTRAADEQARMAQEIDSLRARVSDADANGAELDALREERVVIRARVTEMLTQLDGLSI